MRSRPLKLTDLVLYGVASSLAIRWLASAATIGPSSLPLWVAALLGFMAPLVIATAELVGRFPGEGGLYDWCRDALSPFAGFLVGWLYWTSNLPYFSGILYFVVGVLAAAAGPQAQALVHQPIAFAAVASLLALAIGGLQLAGLGSSKWLTNFGALATASLLATLIGLGVLVAAGRGTATDFVHAHWAPPMDASGAAVWAIMVFAYGGPESLAFLRGEVRGGTRGVLKVLALVGALQTFAYVAGAWAMLAILRPGQASRLSGISDAFAFAFAKLGAPGLATPALLLLALAMMGAYCAWFGVAARLPFVVGADRYLPAAFGHRDARTGAPTAALITQVVVVLLLVWLGEAGASIKAAYDFLVSMSVLSYTVPFVLLFLVYVRVQRRDDPAGEWIMPGGRGARRALGAVGLATTLTAIACTLVPSPDAPDKLWAAAKLVIASGVLIASGAIAYAVGARRAALAAAGA